MGKQAPALLAAFTREGENVGIFQSIFDEVEENDSEQRSSTG